jgi:hypothetical protein
MSDLEAQMAFVNRRKDEIENAARVRSVDRYRDAAYRQDLGGYYSRGGAGCRDD